MSIDFGYNPILSLIGDLRDFGIEFALRRYPGLYGGKIVDNVDDEQKQARSKVCVSVLGVGTAAGGGKFIPATISRRALPSSIYAGQDHGIYFPPEEGDSVWVSFDHGDPDTPRTHGSWWKNADPNKNPAKSEVPAEFRLGRNGEPTTGAPRRRGIKSKFGHGLIFSDDESAPYVALWAGKQSGIGEAAVVQQQITLVDESASGIPTAGAEEKVDAGIYANTNEGLRVELNDKEKSLLVAGKPATPAGISDNSIKIEELPGGKISIKTKGAPGARNEIILDATTGIVSLNATGAMLISATGGIAMGSGAAPPAPGVPGASVETGAGTKLINFAGLVTETLGGFIQTSATVVINAATSMIVNTAVFNVNSPAASIGPPGFGIVLFGGLVTIGNPLTAQQVTNAELIEFLKTHSHIGNLGGATPLSPADILALQDPLNPSLPNPLYVTQTKMI